MKKSLVAAILASTMIASPALARDDSWYVELDAGATKVENTRFDIGTVANAATIEWGTGPDIGGIVGHDFGAFRLEAEASWRKVEPKTMSTSVRIPGKTGVNGRDTFIGFTKQFVGDGTGKPESQAESRSLMLNGLLDFGADDGLQGYLGGGAGIAESRYRVSVESTGPGWLDDTHTGFAWQALAGVRVPVNHVVDLGLKYRFFNAPGVNLVDTDNRAVHTRWRSHSLLLTFGFNFGGHDAPPPPLPVPVPVPVPAPVPVPVPVPAPVCEKGPYIVFFDWDKSDITPEAATILDSAVTAYGNCANVPIMLAGYTDRSGSTQYNQGLSERRNSSVTGYLTSHGVPGSAISSQGFGESNNRVPTADGVRELQNRRVEITYGPGSGM
jgi:OmpA-OmpF porin, OOP family